MQEVQDNSGAASDGVVSADRTASMLIAAIEAETGGTTTYRYVDGAPANNQEGGEPGGNIRVGFLYRTDRVAFDFSSPFTGRVHDTDGDNAWATPSSARVPLSARFEFLPTGADFYGVSNHWSSRGSGSTPQFGVTQPAAVNEQTRQRQAAEVNEWVDTVLAGIGTAADRNVFVLGDFNTFPFTSSVDIAAGGDGIGTITSSTDPSRVLWNTVDLVAKTEVYTYNFQGNAQALDNFLVSKNVWNTTGAGIEVDYVNATAGFVNTDPATSERSDHNPLLVRIDASNAALGGGTTPAFTAQGISDITTWTIGASSTYTLPTNPFGAPGGGTFTYNIRQADGSALPSWLSFNAGTGALTGTPTSNDTLSLAATATYTLSGNARNGFTQVDVFKITPTGGDTSAPVVASSSVTDNQMGVLVGQTLTFTFSETIAAIDTTQIKLFQTVGDVQVAATVSKSGATLTIDPTANLAADTDFYVSIPTANIKDAANNAFAGFTNTTAFNFKSTGAPTTLAVGDIAVIGMSPFAGLDSFHFVALRDINPGTEIRFSDKGWRSDNNTFGPNPAPTNAAFEQEIVWTASALVTKGAVVGPITNGGLHTTGDQIIAFTGTTAAPTFLHAVNNEGAGVWQANATIERDLCAAARHDQRHQRRCGHRRPEHRLQRPDLWLRDRAVRRDQ